MFQDNIQKTVCKPTQFQGFKLENRSLPFKNQISVTSDFSVDKKNENRILAFHSKAGKILFIIHRNSFKRPKHGVIQDIKCFINSTTRKSNNTLKNHIPNIDLITLQEDSQISHYESMHKMLCDQQTAYSKPIPDEGQYTSISPTNAKECLMARTSLEQSSNESEDNFEGRPSPEHLERVYNSLSETVSNFFLNRFILSQLTYNRLLFLSF